jgi:hypothetical protein
MMQMKGHQVPCRHKSGPKFGAETSPIEITTAIANIALTFG